jgi:hypothetical protein
MGDDEEPTRFVESNILLAVGGGSQDHTRELLRSLSRPELMTFARTIADLDDLIDEEMGRR